MDTELKVKKIEAGAYELTAVNGETELWADVAQVPADTGLQVWELWITQTNHKELFDTLRDAKRVMCQITARQEQERLEAETATPLGYEYDDGGRQAAGYKGSTGNCVVRAIAITTDFGYQHVYDAMADAMKCAGYARSGNAYATRKRKDGKPAKGNGLNGRQVQEMVLRHFGFEKVKLAKGPRPTYAEAHKAYGECIVSTTKHMAALKGGALRDTFDGREYDYGDIAGERKAMSVWVRSDLAWRKDTGAKRFAL